MEGGTSAGLQGQCERLPGFQRNGPGSHTCTSRQRGVVVVDLHGVLSFWQEAGGDGDGTSLGIRRGCPP